MLGRRIARVLTVLVLAPFLLGRAVLRIFIKNADKFLLSLKFRHCGKNVSIGEPDMIIGHRYISIADNVYIHRHCRWDVVHIDQGHDEPRFEIGSGVQAGHQLHVACSNYVKIGSNVLIASNVFITDTLHAYEDPGRAIKLQEPYSPGPVVIEDDCWLGYGSVILPGVVIGRHSVVGSNAVVTESIPSFSVAVGNPARVIRRYDRSDGAWTRVK